MFVSEKDCPFSQVGAPFTATEEACSKIRISSDAIFSKWPKIHCKEITVDFIRNNL